MWRYALVDDTGPELVVLIDGQGEIGEASTESPVLVGVNVEFERERGVWVCAPLVEYGPFDWRLGEDATFSDDGGEPVRVSWAVRRAPKLDTELRRVAGLLESFRQHVAGLAPDTGREETRALAALDSARFAVRTQRGQAKADMSLAYVREKIKGNNTEAQGRYRDRARAGIKPPRPATDEEREELAWPARVWRRRASRDLHPQQ